MVNKELEEYKTRQIEAKAQKAQAELKSKLLADKSKKGNFVKKVSNAVKYSSKLSKNLLSYSNALGGSSTQGSRQSGPGRPKGVMKWRSPFNGQPIPATVYYKQVRQFRNIQAQKAQQIEQQRMQQYAQKGVQPNQVNQVMLERMQQQAIIQQMNNQPVNQINPNQTPQQMVNNNQIPNGTIIPRGNKIWRYRRGEVGTEGGLFGPVQKVYGTPESFFN